ncbi:hypothetical protein H0A71_15100 [Alcaligenaceae bacterium]|nr:hypothetical protein [Alcaligenaceae bacterium]
MHDTLASPVEGNDSSGDGFDAGNVVQQSILQRLQFLAWADIFQLQDFRVVFVFECGVQASP